MSADRIVYDREWMTAYLEELREQRGLLTDLKYEIQMARYSSDPQMRPDYTMILEQIEKLGNSLDSTEAILNRYTDRVENAIYELENKSQRIRIPDFFE